MSTSARAKRSRSARPRESIRRSPEGAERFSSQRARRPTMNLIVAWVVTLSAVGLVIAVLAGLL
jgi:hypothetical protein